MRALQRQKGAVLILLFVALIMGATTVILSALNNRSPQVRDRINKQNEMQLVKEALLSYAMTYPEYSSPSAGPGRLPCSDTNNNASMNCNTSAVSLGRLPQQVVPPIGSPVFLSDRYAGIGQQFWYAVAPGFRQNVASLNTSTPSTFTLDGVGVAALIIAPGAALDGQLRSNATQADLYLESNNATGPNFLSNHPTDPSLFNDIVMPISVAEVLTYGTMRVGQEIRRVLGVYYAANGNTYPPDPTGFRAAMSASAVAWVAANSWISTSLSSYTRTSTSTATVQFTNCAIVFTFDQAQTGFTRSQRSC